MSDGRWRRVYSLNWLQAAVQGLDDGERVVWLYCLTGPQSTSVGIYRLSTAVAVEDLGNVTSEDFERRLHVVCRTLDWRFDPAVRVLWISGWIDENPPQSPNVVVSWRKLLDNVPDCQTKADAVNAIYRALKDMKDSFREQFGSYRVSLPKDSEKPKPQVQSNQGSGIRDLGIQGNRENAALRAVALKDENNSPSEIDSKLRAIAREVIRANPQTTSTEELLDHFQCLQGPTQTQRKPNNGTYFPSSGRANRVIRGGLRNIFLCLASNRAAVTYKFLQQSVFLR